MPFRMSHLMVAAVVVLAVALYVTVGVVEALVMVLIVAALAGVYLLRRYARSLVYARHTATSNTTADVAAPRLNKPAT